LATGIAVLMSCSVTQIADFIRRTMELFVLLLSWLVFRYLTRGEGPAEETKKKWERVVNLSVAVALGVSGLIMIFLALFRFQSFRPGGNVYLGLVIAVLGFGVNLWFWKRYIVLGSVDHDPIIEAQRRLYLAKVFVDICVISALSSIALIPAHVLTRYIDTLGSLAVAVYLLWSASQTWNAAQK
jgi:divalent metal cation (Fe/Co/Zn/Cd) transporter